MQNQEGRVKFFSKFKRLKSAKETQTSFNNETLRFSSRNGNGINSNNVSFQVRQLVDDQARSPLSKTNKQFEDYAVMANLTLPDSNEKFNPILLQQIDSLNSLHPTGHEQPLSNLARSFHFATTQSQMFQPGVVRSLNSSAQGSVEERTSDGRPTNKLFQKIVTSRQRYQEKSVSRTDVFATQNKEIMIKNHLKQLKGQA